MHFQSSGRLSPAAGLKHGAIAKRLSLFGPLNDAEAVLVREVCEGPATSFAIRSIIQFPRENAEGLRFIASGWAVQVRELRDGRRQLIQLLLPGDRITVGPTKTRVHFLQALAPVQIIDASAIAVAAADSQRHPGLTRALARIDAIERELLMDYIVRLGRQTALERISHLLMELHARLGAIGMTDHDELPFRMTQEVVADLLGLSVVHVNRTLMALKRAGTISIAHGRVQLMNIPELEKLSEFRAMA